MVPVKIERPPEETTIERLAHRAGHTPRIGSFLAGSSAGNSIRPLGLLHGSSKGVK